MVLYGNLFGTCTLFRRVGSFYMIKFFDVCAELLSNGKHSNGQSPNVDRERNTDLKHAQKFLDQLGYVSFSQELSNEKSSEKLDDIQFNQLMLLQLAAQFDNAFSLLMQYSPGAFFFGAMLTPSSIMSAASLTTSTGVGGRGGTFRQAFESCMGEAAEFLSSIAQKNDQLVCSFDGSCKLTKEELAWSLSGLGLKPNQDLSSLSWIQARSLNDAREVFFPAELVLRETTENSVSKRLYESTGVGAGPTISDATFSGLMEVVERDAFALWWYGGEKARKVDVKSLNEFGFNQFGKSIRKGNKRKFWFLDLTSDIGIPVVACLSSFEDGQSVVAGFSAHPNTLSALRGAFLEMCQMELAQELSLSKLDTLGEDHLQDLDRIWIERFSSLSVKNFVQLHESKETVKLIPTAVHDPLTAALEMLKTSGNDPFLVNLTRNEIQIPVVKILIPGLQSSKSDWVSDRLQLRKENFDYLSNYGAYYPSPM